MGLATRSYNTEVFIRTVYDKTEVFMRTVYDNTEVFIRTVYDNTEVFIRTVYDNEEVFIRSDQSVDCGLCCEYSLRFWSDSLLLLLTAAVGGLSILPPRPLYCANTGSRPPEDGGLT